MGKLNLPSTTKPKIGIYENLLGVDFRADQTETGRRRSPNMVNMISDLGGNPIKRDGFRKVSDAYAGIVTANSETYGVRTDSTGIVAVPIIFEEGEDVISEDATKSVTIPNSGNGFGKITDVFGYQQYIFVMFENGGAKIDVIKREYEITGITNEMMSKGALGASAPRCEEIVPVSIIGMQPNAQGTAGTVLYGKNLMSIYQQYRYAGDGTSKDFEIPLYSKMGNWVKVEVMDANANWEVKALGTDYTLGTASNVKGATLDGKSTADYSVVDAKVTFKVAPAKPNSTLAGEDNVRITCAPFNMNDTIEIGGEVVKRGYYNENLAKLFKSKAHFLFESRLFFGVVEKTYYSEVNNPFLVPDNYWFDVDGEIICFQRMSGSLAVITQDTGKNTIFLAKSIQATSTVGDGMTATFSVTPTNAGAGSITRAVGGVLNDEPIFLSTTGIHGILTNWTSEKYAVNRSGRINRRMCKESHLENAIGCAFNGYYYLAINTHMYVLDGRHKDNLRSGETSYECYYFEGLPQIKSMFVAGNRMFFTDENSMYTWNNDLNDRNRYYDYLILEDGERKSGKPVSAVWSTAFDDDGLPELLKTLRKKGSMVVLVPFAHTGCDVTLVKDGDQFQHLGYSNTSIFSFDEVNFGYALDDEGNEEKDEPQFIFSSNTVAYDRFIKKKVKKYKRLQIIVSNDRAEPFSIVKVVKTYDLDYSKFAKR